MNSIMQGTLKLDRTFTDAESDFWHDFCLGFPAFKFAYLSDYKEYYQSNISNMVYDYEKIKSNDISCKILNDLHFNSFCTIMNKLVPFSTKEQHFLLFLLANDLTSWDIELHRDNSIFSNKTDVYFIPNQLKTDWHFHTLPMQISLLSALVEENIINKIYPQLEFILPSSLYGNIGVNKTILLNNPRRYFNSVQNIKNRNEPVKSYKYHSIHRKFILEFSYSHIKNSFDESNNKDATISNYKKYQSYLINFIENIALENQIEKMNS